MSVQQFARGKAVYGQGSYAPTRGQVSAQGAQGYLKRELRKDSTQGVSSYGGDGMSDTRSGVASAALARNNKNKPKTGGGRSASGPQIPQTGGGRPVSGPVGGGSATSEQPNVTINSNGQLQLPYNAEWNETVLSSLGDYNNQLLDVQTQRQQQAMDFMNQNRQADLDYSNLKRDTLSKSAGAGTAFSSGYGLAVGNNANQYNNFKNQLASQNTLLNNSFDLQQSGIVDNFNNILRSGALSLADSTAQDAGSLGFGSTAPVTSGPGRPIMPSKDTNKIKPLVPLKPSKNKHSNAAKAKMNRGRNAS